MKLFDSEQEALDWAKSLLVQIGDKWTYDVKFNKGEKKKFKVQNDDLDALVDRILELNIPNHKVGSSSVSFKPNRVDLRDHLERFYKIYSYDTSVVYEAVKTYIEEVNNEGTMYKKALKYFVHKQGEGSGLADYCDKVLQGNIEEHTFNKVL